MEKKILEVGDILYNGNGNYSPDIKIVIESVTATQAKGGGVRLQRQERYEGCGFSQIGEYGSFHYGDENTEARYIKRCEEIRLQKLKTQHVSTLRYHTKWDSMSLEKLQQIIDIISS